jgi:hypothetical protein
MQISSSNVQRIFCFCPSINREIAASVGNGVITHIHIHTQIINKSEATKKSPADEENSRNQKHNLIANLKETIALFNLNKMAALLENRCMPRR